MGDIYRSSWPGWVLHAPYDSIVPCFAGKDASVFRNEKMRGFIVMPITWFDTPEVPLAPKF